MNLFRYCADDPVDLTDPMGLTPFSRDEFRTNLTSWGSSNEWVKVFQADLLNLSRDPGFTMASFSIKAQTPTPTAYGESLKHMRQMIKASEDSTAKILKRGDGPIYGKVYQGQKMVTQKAVREYVKIEKGDKIFNFVHVHTRSGKDQNSLSDYDERVLRIAPMYFTTRDWVQTRRIEYEGNTYRGNYIFIQRDGSMRPYYDPQLTLR
jgi:hypothetical protein